MSFFFSMKKPNYIEVFLKNKKPRSRKNSIHHPWKQAYSYRQSVKKLKKILEEHES